MTRTAWDKPLVITFRDGDGQPHRFPGWSTGGEDTLIDLRIAETFDVDRFWFCVAEPLRRAAAESTPPGFVLVSGRVAHPVDVTLAQIQGLP